MGKGLGKVCCDTCLQCLTQPVLTTSPWPPFPRALCVSERKCSNCHKVGHNIRSCPTRPAGHVPKSAGGKGARKWSSSAQALKKRFTTAPTDGYYMFFDLETAGLHATSHPILSITAMLLEMDDLDDVRAAVLAGGEAWIDELDQEGEQLKPPAAFANYSDYDGPVFTTFIKPNLGFAVDVHSDCHAANGITDSDLATAPYPLEVWTQMLAWMGRVAGDHPVVLVAHNGNKFDLPFLAHRLRRYQLALPGNVTHLVDTMQVAYHAELDKAEHDYIKQDGEEAGDIGHYGRRNLGAMYRDVVHGAGFEQHLGVSAHTSLGDVLAMLVLFTTPVIFEPARGMAIPVETSSHAHEREAGSDAEDEDDGDAGDSHDPGDHELVADSSNNAVGDGAGEFNDVEPTVEVDEQGTWLTGLAWNVDQGRSTEQMLRPDFRGKPAPAVFAGKGTPERPGGHSLLGATIGAGDRKVPFDAVNDMLGGPLNLLVTEARRYKLQKCSVRRIEIWWLQCLIRKRSSDIPVTTPGTTMVGGRLCTLVSDVVRWNDAAKEAEYQGLRAMYDRMPFHVEPKLGRTRPCVQLVRNTEVHDGGADTEWWADPEHEVPPQSGNS